MPLPSLKVPILNSANPWATTRGDLQKLFDCPYTGAVTIRTSLLHGFEHDDETHQHTFFDPHDHSTKLNVEDGEVPSNFSGCLNTLGYSPILLSTYLATIAKVIQDSTLPDDDRNVKPLIISVTGSAEAIKECYQKIQHLQSSLTNPLCMEINLSCPNIPDKPPPAYSGDSLVEYLKVLENVEANSDPRNVKIGIKTPPYTYHDQFQTLIVALLAVNPCPIDFITATITLGNSLVVADANGTPAINSASGTGIGGMAGAPLHPLALGNVKTIRTMLDQHSTLESIGIIGVGGVADKASFDRMRAVGADAVGVGTALGREGAGVFEKIMTGRDGS